MDDTIKDLLNDPDYKMSVPKMLLTIHIANLKNKLLLNTILYRQIKEAEQNKGKTGQELDDAIKSELDRLNKKHQGWLKEEFIDDINFFTE